MRIALVSSSVATERPGGSEVYAAELATALARSHEVCLFTGATTPVPGVRSQTLPALPELQPNESNARKALWHLRDQWLPAVHRTLVRGLNDFAPDVVNTHHPQGLSGAVFTAARVARARHVHTVLDANALCARITMTVDGEYCGGRCARCFLQRAIRTRQLARSVDLLIAHSTYFRDLYVRASAVPIDRTQVIPMGAAPGTLRIRQRDGELFTIGFMGAVARHKGIATLLDAFARAPSHWRLRVAGTGPLLEIVDRAVARDPRIDCVGFVVDDEKDAFFDSLDVFVIPSEYEEHAPLVAAEAAVRGLPAVVSDRGGLPETPEASVVQAGDPYALFEALRTLADSPNRLHESSRRLTESHEHFLWSTHVKRVENALQGAVRQ